MTARTLFAVTSRHMIFTLEHPAIVTGVFVGAPVVSLASELDALEPNAIRDKASDCLRFADTLGPSLDHPHSAILDESVLGHRSEIFSGGIPLTQPWIVVPMNRPTAALGTTIPPEPSRRYCEAVDFLGCLTCVSSQFTISQITCRRLSLAM